MGVYRGSTAVIATGSVLLLLALGHHLGEASRVVSRVGPVVSLLLDGGLAISLVYAGWWLRRTDITARRERSVAIWTVLGAIAGAGIAGLTLFVEFIEGRPLVEPPFSLLVHAGSGAIGLFFAGVYASRLQAVNNRFETLFDNTVRFTGLLKPDGTVLEINEAAATFGGVDRSEVVGQQFHEVSWWTHSEAAYERVRDALTRAAGGETLRYDAEVQGADGLRTVDFSVRPVTDGRGRTTYLIVEGSDITEKKQQQQHLQILHRVVRHNMRNDLNKIRGWTRNAATASAHEERVAAADRVRRVIDSWTKMIADVKQIQQGLESEREALDRRPAEVLLPEIVQTQQSAHPAVEFELTMPDPPVGRIPQPAETAIIETIDNAIQATSADTPVIDITVERTDNNWLEVHISDNGPGIPDAEATVLETGEETPLFHGSRLGVWKIRVLTKQVGGNISVNTHGDGTAVKLKIPRSPQQQMPAVNQL